MLVLEAINSHKDLLIEDGVKEPIDLTLMKQHGSSDPANVILVSLWIIVIT
tara:strand:+ start:973 stop:1125 length:153 start_codon:yes stop_codon:yes gene_type:complete